MASWWSKSRSPRKTIRSYKQAIDQYKARKLQPEADLVAEELEAFIAKLRGLPEWCKAVEGELAREFIWRRTGGSEAKYKLADLLVASKVEQDLGMSAGNTLHFRRGLIAAITLQKKLSNPMVKGMELEDLRTESLSALNDVRLTGGSPGRAQLLADLKLRLTGATRKNPNKK